MTFCTCAGIAVWFSQRGFLGLWIYKFSRYYWMSICILTSNVNSALPTECVVGFWDIGHPIMRNTFCVILTCWSFMQREVEHFLIFLFIFLWHMWCSSITGLFSLNFWEVVSPLWEELYIIFPSLLFVFLLCLCYLCGCTKLCIKCVNLLFYSFWSLSHIKKNFSTPWF